MKMTGSYEIAADRETVWQALNDPEVLRDCIPGCESLEMTAENELTAAVTAKVGPVKAKFTGVVELKDLNPPESYRIEGSGKGGAAGFAKGGANVSLAESGDGTTLTYDADAQVGGKLAQIGGRLIDGTAKKMADQFFAAFSEKVAGRAAATAAANAAPENAAEAAAEGATVEVAPEPAPEAAAEVPAPAADADATTADESVAEQAAAAAAAAGAAEPPPSGAANLQSGPAASGSSGVPAWVWFLGAIGLLVVLVALVS